MDHSARTLLEVEEGLATFPSQVSQEYRKARQELEARFTAGQVHLWASEGLSIGRRAFRSWEAAAEYFRVSPRVFQLISIENAAAWARLG